MEEENLPFGRKYFTYSHPLKAIDYQSLKVRNRR